MNNNSPVITIIIATYNSEKTLEQTLISIRKQIIDQDSLEILVVDGGSTDRTLAIAKKYHCRIVHNSMIEPMSAKYLGFHKAIGRYVIGIDHDEVLANKNSLALKLQIFRQDKRVKVLHSSGYITPSGSRAINFYINEFGDPFSFFIYHLTKDFRYFIPLLKKRYPIIYEDKNYLLMNVSVKNVRIPLMEVVTAGAMIDKKYLLTHLKEVSKNKLSFLPNLQYHLLTVNPYAAVMKNDPLYHYSSENIRKYLKKLEWRIKNNIYFLDTAGSAGFLKREQHEGKKTSINKYLFIPYSFSLVLPCLDALWLCITRKNMSYLIHIPLTVYTASLTVYHYIKRSFGFSPVLTSYDGSSEIVRKWT